MYHATLQVVGLGKSGRAAARLALVRGASVIAIDRNENLAPLEQDLLTEKHGKLRTILGHCDRELLEDTDRVVVSPGVSIENYGLSSLLQSGRPVMSELDFASEVLPKSIKVLAVTGTNGKSTVTTFAGQVSSLSALSQLSGVDITDPIPPYKGDKWVNMPAFQGSCQMLSHLGVKVFVGGNLGNPLSEAAIQCLTLSSVAVVEVSSYQMEIPNKYFCPSVSVVLNLTPDHLERHKTMRNYALTKCRVFSHMSNSKLAVLPDATIGSNEGNGDAQPSKCCSGCVSVIGLDVGIDTEAIGATIETLNAPPHRMQIADLGCSTYLFLPKNLKTSSYALPSYMFE
ncbi:hypothetical protein HHK36_032909 [Tetracentron sinense]|uniref:Mur ligase central domain-containing protein n=1 Tax=Tetracentron sinense TaxID=13715 RepID=A0A835CZ49_TETSI|nr:hypothetical protein HHK36_032909 [Tetracentron sinense]